MHRISGRILLITAAFALFLVPVAAIAAGGFEDVSDSNVFKADIQWMKDAGVTKGCNPPANTKFCPSDNVTREQMSAFMHRLAVNQVVDAKTAMNADKLDGFSVEAITPRASTASYVGSVGDSDGIRATVKIEAPARGILIANAGGDSYDGTGDQICALGLDGAPFGVPGYVDHDLHDEADCIVSGSVVVDPGVHKVDLEILGDAVHDGTLWVMWVPFDGVGAVPSSISPLGSPARDKR